jgi:hypothetical protein
MRGFKLGIYTNALNKNEKSFIFSTNNIKNIIYIILIYIIIKNLNTFNFFIINTFYLLNEIKLYQTFIWME